MLKMLYTLRLLKQSHAYQNILAHLHLFHTFAGGLMRQKLVNFRKNSTFIYLSTFSIFPFSSCKGLNQAANEPEKLEFYKSDFIIRLLIQINLPVQKFQYLTAFSCHFISFLRIFGHFTHYGCVTSLMGPKNQNFVNLTLPLYFSSRQAYPYKMYSI